MKKTRIFYGMSGTFKGSTIKKMPGIKIWSLIKPWKTYESSEIFSNLIPHTNNMTYGILHFANLKGTLENMIKDEEVNLERGISDMIYFYERENSFLTDSEKINLIEEEINIIKPREIEKILLIQEDTKFIKDVILKDIHRAAKFKGGVDEYMEEQEKYIKHTTSLNRIDRIVRIPNAIDYLENL